MSLLNKIKKAILLCVEGVIRNIGGPVGIKIRRQYYKRRFAKCGINIRIEEGVIISGPESIYVQDNVWIDKYCILMAGEIQGIDRQNINYRKQDAFSKKRGELHIGSNSHIGIRTIIQAHSGVELGDYFTSSADCKIYSFSNDVKMCRHGTIGLHDVYFIDSPITIQDNVWLGLNCIVVGGKIGNNTFVMPNSIVISDIEDNSIVDGFPARRIKRRIDF